MGACCSSQDSSNGSTGGCGVNHGGKPLANNDGTNRRNGSGSTLGGNGLFGTSGVGVNGGGGSGIDLNASQDLPPGSTGSCYGQRAFVYPKMPALPKRSGMTNNDWSGNDGNSKRASGAGAQVSAFESRVNIWFDRYCERTNGDPDVMLSDGIVRWCSDLRLSPEAFPILVFAWRADAGQMCRFTRAEFSFACRRLKADDARSLLPALTAVGRELSDSKPIFKDFYRWSYNFAVDSEIGQRILSMDIAIQLWRLVFTPRKHTLFEDWLSFLNESDSSIRGL